MRRLILLLPLASLLCQIAPSRSADTPHKAAKIDKLISQYAECCAFTGTVLVSDHNKIIFKKGYGALRIASGTYRTLLT